MPPDFKAKPSIFTAIYNDGAPQQFLKDGKLVGIQPALWLVQLLVTNPNFGWHSVAHYFTTSEIRGRARPR